MGNKSGAVWLCLGRPSCPAFALFMVSSTHFLQRNRYIQRSGWQVDFSAFSAVLLSIFTFYLVCTTRSVEAYGEQPFVQLPSGLYRGSGGKLPDKFAITISVDAQARMYFSHDYRRIQTEAIRQAATSHGVLLTSQQLTALTQLPYLGLDLRQLPTYLALPRYEQRKIQLPGLPNDSLLPQLAECVLLARKLSVQRFGQAPYIFLRMDGRLSAAEAGSVMRVLQQKGLNRFYLVRL